MGSHYIPVSGITIDTIKDAITDALPDLIDLDILCPAAGYDTTPPNPAIYCPANGYFPDDSWVPPVETVNPDGSGGDQILLLVDDQDTGVIAVTMGVSAGSRKLECLSTDMTVLDTVVSAGTFNYALPTRGAGKNYIIRLSPDTAGASITGFSRATFTGYPVNYRILQAKFHTPNITSLISAFYQISAIKECIFHTDMNSLTSLYQAFRESGIEKITWPSQMNALTTISYAFTDAKYYRNIDLSGVSMNLLSNMSYMCQLSGAQSLKLPSSLPEAANLAYMCTNSYLLRSVQLPTSMPKVTSIQSIFQNCYLLEGNFTFPEMPLCTNKSYAFQRTSISKLAFAGQMLSLASGGAVYVASYCNSLREFVCASEYPAVFTPTQWLQLASLTKFVPPQKVNFAMTFTTENSYLLENFETSPDWGTQQHNINISSHKLLAFNQPSLRVSALVIGYSSTLPAQLTAIEIDWANSTYSLGGTQVTIRAQLPTAEINRIFTALPVVVGKIFDARYNPGYADCDKTIATAKGWTVL